MDKRKSYVLDTNVLIQAPHALISFEDNEIILPIAVLEELDRHKADESDLGINARQAIRMLDQLRARGDLLHGVDLPDGGRLRLETNFADITLPANWQQHASDNRILQVCKGLINRGTGAILVSRDIVLRIKADVLGIPAEDFTTDQAPLPEAQYRGRRTVFAPDECFATFKRRGIDPGLLYTISPEGRQIPVEAVANEFFIIQSELNVRKTLLGRFDGRLITALETQQCQPFGVRPRNVGQRFLQEALLRDAESAPLVIVKGIAGTAKTFYALAAGLQQIIEEKEPLYRRILFSRSNVQFDNDIGFLPGTEQEKIAPLLRPVIDNLEILVDRDEKERYRNEKELRCKVDELFDRGIIAAEAMNFIRGRSITHTYLVIDEAQNLTPRQVKGIITRVGIGTKVVLLGDPEQIDHPMLDSRTNGLCYAAERMKGSPLCWQITMLPEECERSVLAQDAACRM